MSVTTIPTARDPLAAWQRLRAGNERSFIPMRGHRGGLADERPTAVVFRCADAGVASELVFGQDWGTLIEVSTWGHGIDSGVLAAMEYAVDTLAVPLIVVLGHQGCDAVRTAVRSWTEATLPDGAARTVVERTFGSIVRRGVGGDSVDEVTAAHITDTGLALLERSPLLARRVDARACGIVCATVNPADGSLRTHATIGPVGDASDALLECV